MDPITLEMRVIGYVLGILLLISMPLGGYFYGHHAGYLERGADDKEAVAAKVKADAVKDEADRQYYQKQGEQYAKTLVDTNNYWNGELARLRAVQAKRDLDGGQKPIPISSTLCGAPDADRRLSELIQHAESEIRSSVADLRAADTSYRSGVAELLRSCESKQTELQSVIDDWNRGAKVNAVPKP